MTINASKWSWAVVGTGALGGYYGGLLARAGQNVQFLARSDVAEMRHTGLSIDSPKGSFHLNPVQVASNSEEMQPVDIVLICLKTTQNHLLPQILPPLLHPQTLIITLQNGLGVEEELAREFPGHAVAGGLCFLCAHKTGPGQIHHLDYGAIRLGMHRQIPHGTGPALAELQELMQRAGIPVSLTRDLRTARWQKLVWNIPFNGLSVLLQATTDQLLAHPESSQLVERLMREVALLAAHDGCTIEDSFIQKMIADTAKMVPYKTSMYLDYEAKRPLELKYMFAVPLSCGPVDSAPAIQMLAQGLHFLSREK